MLTRAARIIGGPAQGGARDANQGGPHHWGRAMRGARGASAGVPGHPELTRGRARVTRRGLGYLRRATGARSVYPVRRRSERREPGVSARASSINSLIAFWALTASFAAIAVNTRR